MQGSGVSSTYRSAVVNRLVRATGYERMLRKCCLQVILVQAFGPRDWATDTILASTKTTTVAYLQVL